MKSAAGLLWAITAVRTIAATPEASVYTFPDSNPLNSPVPPSICPNDARLLVAQRLGLAKYHSLGNAEEVTLDLLNRYQGENNWQSELSPWSKQPSSSQRRLLIFVEGVENPQDIFDAAGSIPSFKIHNPPSAAENYELITYLIDQDKNRRWDTRCTTDLAKPGYIHGYLNYEVEKDGGCTNDYTHFTSPEMDEDGYQKLTATLNAYLTAFDGTENGQTGAFQVLTLEKARQTKAAAGEAQDAYHAAIKDIQDALDLITTSQPSIITTLILLPPSTSSAKKSTTSPYESYSVSDLPSKLTRRAQPQTEEPLSAVDPVTPASASAHPSPAEILANSTSPVRGALPICHLSKKTTIAATHNCSGHGTPYLKYQTKSSNESNVMIECWACKCSTSVFTDEDGGVKTVYWGGPACQKKDISTAFWLLAALGIGLAATISWGIGLMYSIGEEDLPSVIGAGVAGPRAQK